MKILFKKQIKKKLTLTFQMLYQELKNRSDMYVVYALYNVLIIVVGVEGGRKKILHGVIFHLRLVEKWTYLGRWKITLEENSFLFWLRNCCEFRKVGLPLTWERISRRSTCYLQMYYKSNVSYQGEKKNKRTTDISVQRTERFVKGTSFIWKKNGPNCSAPVT